MMYTVGVDVQFYLDNVMVAQEGGRSTSTTSIRSGHIFIGRHFVYGDGFFNGKLTVDWLSIWDRPLTEEERNLVHLN